MRFFSNKFIFRCTLYYKKYTKIFYYSLLYSYEYIKNRLYIK